MTIKTYFDVSWEGPVMGSPSREIKRQYSSVHLLAVIVFDDAFLPKPTNQTLKPSPSLPAQCKENQSKLCANFRCRTKRPNQLQPL